METPRSLKACDSRDTPGTSFSTIFDSDDSPLSSPSSSELSDIYDSSDHDKSSRNTKASTLFDDPGNRETAASQRPRRGTKSLAPCLDVLPALNKQIEQRVALVIKQIAAIAQDVAQPAVATEVDEEPTPAPARCSKRNQQAAAIGATPEPQPKKVKRASARKSARPRSADDSVFAVDPQSPPATPAAPRVLRKRETYETVGEPPRTPALKTTRTSAINAPSKSKFKSETKSSTTPRKGNRTRTKTQKQLLLEASLVEDPPVTKSLVVFLKTSPSWFLPGGKLEKMTDSQHTESSTQKNTSFDSMSDRPAVLGEDQCAQSVWTPVPASSLLTSTDGSSFLRTQSSPQSQTIVPQEPSTATLQGTSPISPNKDAEEPAVKGPLPVNASNKLQIAAEVDEEPHLATASSYETQPTQILTQPYKYLRSRDSVIPRPGYAVSDTGSDATTVEEEPFVPPEGVPVSQEHPELYGISEQLFANRKPGLKKPAPAGQPEVWAEGRQELCETLHYYRSYQSGCYSTGGFARGMMFDKVAHARDYVDNDVVISRAGGGLVKDNDSGQMRSGRDQADQGPVVTALNNCIVHCNPVVLLTGADNPHIPSQPPHQYCVLDYFKPTHIWVEKSNNSKIVRYRFEKLNTKKKSWWRPEHEQNQVELGSLDPPNQKICDCCGEMSLQIYLNGWMCLQPSCTAFWYIIKASGPSSYRVSREPDEAELVYDPRFLKQKTPWLNDNMEYSLRFDRPEVSDYALPGEATSQSFSSGIVCPDCGRCNSRIAWTGWECSTPNCNYKLEHPHSLISARSLHEPFWPLNTSYTMSRDINSLLLDVSISFAHGYRINRYKIPGLDGFITHMIANKTVVDEAGGPNTMFEELQQTDIGLRRRIMPNGQLKGDSYCRHFNVNYGMPYKFIAATASLPFDGAPRPINATRSRLIWAAKYLAAQETAKQRIAQDSTASPHLQNYHDLLAQQTSAIMQESTAPAEFNEVLALGYFESQKINYHDDGEFGLGPTIATLSLGAPGTMRIRMKARHYHGVSSAAGVYDDARPIPGCAQYAARLALQPELDALKVSDPRAYRARLKAVPKELALKYSGHAKDVLKMELGHGDIVVMHGAEVQKYYEHAVEHAGKLRFALTCRYIDPESLKVADKPSYEVGPDLEGYDGTKLC